MRRALLSWAILMVTGCFAPRFQECAFVCGAGEVACPPAMTCGNDGFCHEPGENETCGGAVIDGSVADRPLADASLGDGRTDGASPVDVAATADRATADGPPPDAADCVAICEDERTCGFVAGCSCGGCDLDAEWCGDLCIAAVCETNNCCLPENAPCVPGLGQCCAGLTCVFFCSP